MTKALVVLTNHEKFENMNRVTGLWLSEAVHFSKVMEDNGVELDYVSPKGGYIPLDPGSIMPDSLDPISMEYYLNEDFRNHVLGGTMKPSDVNADDYDVIYFAGGHGTIWDFPKNEELGKIAKSIYDNGGVISAVCHGVAGILPIQTDDGQKFITGKNVAGFTNEEEAINGLTDAVPVLVEDELKAAGANFSKSDAYTEHVVVDGRLVTGQNPQSAAGVGKAVTELIK